jgi:WD40 repeat protein
MRCSPTSKFALLMTLICLPAAGLLSQTESRTEQEVSFKRDIAPILLAKCESCHGETKTKGKYRVDTYKWLSKKGEGGVPGITRGDPGKSELYFRLSTHDKEERMPPEAGPLPPPELEMFRNWILQGAEYDGGDPDAQLSSIVPPPVHPHAPSQYPAALAITALAWAPGGHLLYSSGYHEILVWDSGTKKLSARIRNLAERTYQIQFSPNGKQLAAASGNPGRLGEVRVFDVATGNLLSVPVRATDVCFDAQFSPDGKWLAAAGADGKVRIVDTSSWKIHLTITNHSDWVFTVRWDQAGNRIITSSRDQTCKVFDLRNGKRIMTYPGHTGAVQAAEFHPDGKHAVSLGIDKRLTVWNLEDGKKIKDIANFPTPPTQMLQAGTNLFAVMEHRQITQFVVDGNSWKKALEFKDGYQDAPLSAAYPGKDDVLASGCYDGRILIHSKEGKEIAKLLAKP